MRVLILGCGRVGMLARAALAELGHAVTGVRRTPTPGLIAGDAADPELWQGHLPPCDALLVTATPGLRRRVGGPAPGNDVAGMVRLATAHRPGTRLVLTGTTGVCGDAQGGAVDEDGPLDPAAAGLIAIEQAALAHGDACVLRLPALVGDGRDRLVARARACLAQGVPFTVPGDPDRPFSVIHEADAAGLAVEALVGRLADVRGVLHAAAPGCRTVRAWYTHHLRAAGIDLAIVSDGTVRPSRAISANRLWARLPDWPWRTPF